MIVCVCHCVSESDISRAVHQGCASFDEMQVKLAMGSTCGGCDDCAREVFQQHLSALQPAPASGDTVPLPAREVCVPVVTQPTPASA